MLQYYINEFVVFSFLGWVYESIFCTVRKHHWQNRGFLFGPVCPIYGSCVVLGDLAFRFFALRAGTDPSTTPLWKVFLAAALGSAVMEYSTSYVLEKRFHATWWDYSHLPLNLHGRISLLTSLGFGAAGTLIFRFVLPVSERLLTAVPEWLSVLLSYVFVACLAGDYALTEASLSNLLTEIQGRQARLDAEMEARYMRLEERGEQLNETRDAVVQKLNQGLKELVPGEKAWERTGSRLQNTFQRNVLQNIHHFRSEDQDRIAENMLKTLREKRMKHTRQNHEEQTDEKKKRPAD